MRVARQQISPMIMSLGGSGAGWYSWLGFSRLSVVASATGFSDELGWVGRARLGRFQMARRPLSPSRGGDSKEHQRVSENGQFVS